MNELLKLFEGITNVMASENAGREMLRRRKIVTHILTTESIALKERPPKYMTEIGLWGHRDVGRWSTDSRSI